MVVSGKINQTCWTWKGQECIVRYRSISKGKIWEQREIGHSLFVVPSFQIQLTIYVHVRTDWGSHHWHCDSCKSGASLMPYLSSRTVEGLETLTSYNNQNGQDS